MGGGMPGHLQVGWCGCAFLKTRTMREDPKGEETKYGKEMVGEEEEEEEEEEDDKKKENDENVEKAERQRDGGEQLRPP